MIDLSWMAWTWPTATFFIAIFAIIALMGVWEKVSPGGNPRVGILRFETTRGDRLFVSLLWGVDLPLWYALGLCAVFFVLVFRLV
jgi:predicted small integral membrane protein